MFKPIHGLQCAILVKQNQMALTPNMERCFACFVAWLRTSCVLCALVVFVVCVARNMTNVDLNTITTCQHYVVGTITS